MLARARENASKSSVANVKFVESPITSIDLPSSSTDCIISNCVINLVPAQDKHLVFEEIFRLLKPGGRVAVSDILAKKEFPSDLQRDMSLYVGCISGASLVGEYEKWLKDAGFKGMCPSAPMFPRMGRLIRNTEIMIVDKKNNLNIYKEDTRKVDKDKETSQSSCCNSDVKASGCCGSGDLTKPDDAKTNTGTCCGISSCCSTDSQKVKDRVKNIVDIDFDEWVGKYKVLCSRMDMKLLANNLFLGSFSVYAVKP
jgi:arsenite methyltransferase